MLKHSPVPRRLKRRVESLKGLAAAMPEPEAPRATATTPKSARPPLRSLDPNQPRMSPLSLKFTEQQIERLHKIRERTGRRQTELIRDAVDMYLDKMGV
jgi:hypothetical protein